MSKRRRGPTRTARSQGSASGAPERVPVSGVRPKTGVRRGASPAPRRRFSGPAIAVLLVGGVVLAGIVYAAASSFGLGASPLPTIGGASPSIVPTAGGVGPDGCPTSQPAALPAGETRTVTIETEHGDIVIKVDGALSPIAAGNFVALAECGFYDGVVFHRTATLQDGTPFVIQGGDPDGDGRGGPGYTIEDEPVTTAYRRGTVAMARTSQPNSQGSQFFIVLDDGAEPPLASANTYAIFGEVVSGMEVVDAIYQASGGSELPADPVAMTSVTVSSP